MRRRSASRRARRRSQGRAARCGLCHRLVGQRSCTRAPRRRSQGRVRLSASVAHASEAVTSAPQHQQSTERRGREAWGGLDARACVGGACGTVAKLPRAACSHSAPRSRCCTSGAHLPAQVGRCAAAGGGKARQARARPTARSRTTRERRCITSTSHAHPRRTEAAPARLIATVQRVGGVHRARAARQGPCVVRDVERSLPATHLQASLAVPTGCSAPAWPRSGASSCGVARERERRAKVARGARAAGEGKPHAASTQRARAHAQRPPRAPCRSCCASRALQATRLRLRVLQMCRRNVLGRRTRPLASAVTALHGRRVARQHAAGESSATRFRALMRGRPTTTKRAPWTKRKTLSSHLTRRAVLCHAPALALLLYGHGSFELILRRDTCSIHERCLARARRNLLQCLAGKAIHAVDDSDTSSHARALPACVLGALILAGAFREARHKQRVV